jgi:hypothetical protein
MMDDVMGGISPRINWTTCLSRISFWFEFGLRHRLSGVPLEATTSAIDKALQEPQRVTSQKTAFLIEKTFTWGRITESNLQIVVFK